MLFRKARLILPAPSFPFNHFLISKLSQKIMSLFKAKIQNLSCFVSKNSRILYKVFATAFLMSYKRFLSEFFCFVSYMGNVKTDSNTKLLTVLKIPFIKSWLVILTSYYWKITYVCVYV